MNLRAFGLLAATTLAGIATLSAQTLLQWNGLGSIEPVEDEENWLLDNATVAPLGDNTEVLSFGDVPGNPGSQQIVITQAVESGSPVTLFFQGLTFGGSSRPQLEFVAGIVQDANVPLLGLSGNVLVGGGADVLFGPGVTVLLVPDPDENLQHTASVDGGTTLTLLGSISESAGPASVVKTGYGTLVLGTDGSHSDFSGGLEVQQGILGLGQSSAVLVDPETQAPELVRSPVGLSGLKLNGGTELAVMPTVNFVDPPELILHNPIEIDADTELFDVTVQTAEGSLILAGEISGDARLVKTGGLTLTLGNALSTFSGGVELVQGTLALAASSSSFESIITGPAGSGTIEMGRDTTLALAFDGSTVVLHNDLDLGDAAIEPASGEAIIHVGSGGSLSLLGHIDDSPEVPLPVRKTGSGSLTLASGTSNFSGGLTIEAGTVIIADSSTDSGGITGPVGAGTVTLESGSRLAPLESEAVYELHNPVALMGNVLLGGPTAGLKLSGERSGSGDVTIQGNVEYAGNGAFLGDTHVANDTLTLSTVEALDSGHALSLASYASVFVGANQIVERLTGALLSEVQIAIGQELTVDFADETTDGAQYDGVISGDGVLRIGGTTLGNVAFTLSNDQLYQGGTIIEPNGWLTLGDGGETGSLHSPGSGPFPGHVANAGTLAFNRSDQAPDLIIGGAISGAGKLVNQGGWVELTGFNTYSGGTIVQSGGTMVGASSQPFGSGGITVNSGGTLAVRDGFVPNALTLNSGSRIAGHGAFFTAVIGPGVTLSPEFDDTDTLGLLTFEDLTLGEGGIYEWNLLDPDSYDQVLISDFSTTLHVDASNLMPFELRLITLAAPGERGQATGFAPSVTYTFTLIDASGSSIDGFAADEFSLDTSSFDVGLEFDDTAFSLFVENNRLTLSFTPVPEPSTYALILVGAGVIAAGRRRLRRQR